MKRAVIDASALLAFLGRETGHEIVREWLRDSVMSAVNYAEVLQKLVEKPTEQRLLNSTVANLRVEIVDFDRGMAEHVASLYPTARKGISLADRACIALAKCERLPVLTGDHKWESFPLDVEIVFFRRKAS